MNLTKELLKNNKNLNIWVLCSVAKRYGFKSKNSLDLSKEEMRRIKIIRFWIPSLGKGVLGSAIAYSFFLIPAIIFSLFIRPDIILSSTAKLLTGFAASISSKLLNRKLFLDIRDTFSDNYFYFFRWKKRIIFVGLLMLIENIVIKSAYSINLVSPGFDNAFYGWQEMLKTKKIRITYFTNGIESRVINQIMKESKKAKAKDGFYKILYAGNLGIGQDIYSLIKDLENNKSIIKKMIKNKIKILIYGSGGQLGDIKKLLLNDSSKENKLISKVIEYRGLISKKDIIGFYCEVDCLMLQLGQFSSLSMVIPSKIFEYSATNLPILFGAKGFSREFIQNIDGTIYFKQGDAESFYKSIIKAMKKNKIIENREKFLSRYKSDDIYKKYAHHILNN